MCSTKEPKSRRGTSPMVKSRSRVILARDMSNFSLVVVQKWCGNKGAASGAGEARRRNALDDLALEEQEHQDQRQGGKRCRGHVLGVLDAVGALDGVQPLWQGEELGIIGGNERSQKVVPDSDEDEDADVGHSVSLQ